MSDQKLLSHLRSSSTSCSQMVGQRRLAGQSKFIGRNYLSFISGGTTLNMNYYEKLNRSPPKCYYISLYWIMRERWYKFQYNVHLHLSLYLQICTACQHVARVYTEYTEYWGKKQPKIFWNSQHRYDNRQKE